MKTKNIVITGTSRGIGFEMVRRFADEGHRILALSRNSEPIENLGLHNVHAFPCDLSDALVYKSITDYVRANWDRVDILINNAGLLLNKPFADTSIEDFETVYRTNVYGVAELTRVLLPYMSTKSHVVTISSMGGVQGSMKFPGLAAYSSSKAAVITLTELLAEEYKDKGPSFNVLALGAVQTEMLEEAFPGYVAPVSAKDMATYICDFAKSGNRFYNGKLLQVSLSTP